MLANGLVILGLAGIGLLATSFGSFASGSGQPSRLTFPLIGEILIAETEAVLIALSVAIIFVMKSLFSIVLNLKTALYIAEIETQLTDTLARDFFDFRQNIKTNRGSVSDFQTLAIQSTAGLKVFLNSRILFLAEGSLLVSILAVFFLVNPFATIALTIFMSAVLYILNKIINAQLKKNGERQIVGSRQALQASKDLFGIRREAQTGGFVENWLERFNQGRSEMANSSAIMWVLGGLPRFVIETSLILGIFMFIGGVVIFSDIPSQAVTIGIFLAGGLRVMASIIPFQGAITGMRKGAATGQFAFEVLE